MDGQRLSLVEEQQEAILGRRGIEEPGTRGTGPLPLHPCVGRNARLRNRLGAAACIIRSWDDIISRNDCWGGCWLSVLVVAATMLCTPRRSSLKPVRRVTPCVPRESKVRMHRRLFLPPYWILVLIDRVISFYFSVLFDEKCYY